MLRSLLSILSVLVLLVGAALFEHITIGNAFTAFSSELTALAQKTEEERATPEDARSVQRAWEARKETLQIFLPHNDLARADNTLAESVRLIAEGEYGRALPKLEILLHLAETFPATYRTTPANIF